LSSLSHTHISSIHAVFKRGLDTRPNRRWRNRPTKNPDRLLRGQTIAHLSSHCILFPSSF
jgi:hypothetical protein